LKNHKKMKTPNYSEFSVFNNTFEKVTTELTTSAGGLYQQGEEGVRGQGQGPQGRAAGAIMEQQHRAVHNSK
jgi:hypothetical protein